MLLRALCSLAREEAEKNAAVSRAANAERELDARTKQRDSLQAQAEVFSLPHEVDLR